MITEEIIFNQDMHVFFHKQAVDLQNLKSTTDCIVICLIGKLY